MEEVKLTKTGRQRTANYGGKRPGAGRPSGTKDKVTIAGILDQVLKQGNGKNYEEMLVADFMDARDRKDSVLTMKYHQLILQKLLTTVSKIEVTDSAEVVEAKKIAFAAALAKLNEHNQE